MKHAMRFALASGNFRIIIGSCAFTAVEPEHESVFGAAASTFVAVGNGVVAQLAERLVRNEKVAGSIPVGSTILQGP